MEQLTYRFDDFEALETALEIDDTELELDDPSSRDGQWLLVTFAVGEESTSVAAKVVDHGDGLRLRFEDRDRVRLQRFATGEPPQRVSRPPEPGIEYLPPGSRVLVVSGSKAVGQVTSELLRGWGATPDVVGSAEEALDFLCNQKVDVIVVDSTLPGLDSSGFCRALGKLRAHASRPAVLLLGHDPCGADARAGLAAGADDFVVKPFRAQELRARLIGLL